MNESSPLDLVLVETFHEVAATGSVTAAAKVLGRSQPAISHRLRALEDELGVPLFEKVGRRLQLTPYGHRLRERCVELMAMARRLRAAVTEPEERPAGRVSLGCLPTLTAHYLVDALASLLDTWPELRIHCAYALVPALCERVRTGELDLAVLVGAEGTVGLDAEEIGTTSLAAVLPPACAPAGPRCAPSTLRRMRYLAWGGARDATFDVIERFAESARLVDAATPSIPHIESLRELVAAGAGYTILPAYTAARDAERGRVAIRAVRGLDTDLPIVMAHRPGQVQTRALSEVKRAVRACGRANRDSH